MNEGLVQSVLSVGEQPSGWFGSRAGVLPVWRCRDKSATVIRWPLQNSRSRTERPASDSGSEWKRSQYEGDRVVRRSSVMEQIFAVEKRVAVVTIVMGCALGLGLPGCGPGEDDSSRGDADGVGGQAIDANDASDTTRHGPDIDAEVEDATGPDAEDAEEADLDDGYVDATDADDVGASDGGRDLDAVEIGDSSDATMPGDSRADLAETGASDGGDSDIDTWEGDPVGGACDDEMTCATSKCLREEHPRGYCSRRCDDSTPCPSGSHCGFQGTDGGGRCLKSCTDDSQCGRSGYACLQADGVGSEECHLLGSGNAEVGSACASTGECSGGENGYCAPESAGFKGGYCLWRFCDDQTSCPSGSHCSFDGNGKGVCMLDCDSNDDCRADGYTCFDADSDGSSECHPAGTGSKAVGTACSGLWECDTGEQAFCTRNSHFKNGYCTKTDCGDEDVVCPDESHCGFTDSEIETRCLSDCSSDGDCPRDGYACFDRDTDGTTECYPAGTGSRAVGEACERTSQCGGGAWAYCVTEGEWPKGYCSKLCGSDQGTCPSGSTCYSTSTVSLCLSECESDADCRTAYTCNATEGVCVPR